MNGTNTTKTGSAGLTNDIGAPWTPPSPILCASPGAAGGSRNASRARRTNAAWTSTKYATTSAGTGTSPSPCSPTPSWPSPPPRSAKKGSRSRHTRPRGPHPGRDPPSTGNYPPTSCSIGQARAELVEMTPTTPGQGPPLSLHTARSLLRGTSRAKPPRTRHNPARIPTLKPLTRAYTEVRLEY